MLLLLDYSNGNTIKAFQLPMAAPIKNELAMHSWATNSALLSNLDYYSIHMLENWNNNDPTRAFKVWSFDPSQTVRTLKYITLDTSRYINRWGARVLAVDNNKVHVGGSKGIAASGLGFTPLYVVLSLELVI